jgi:elongation factor G
MLLEPIDRVSVQVAQEHIEKLSTDLSSRRGRILDSEPAANGWTLVEAEIPELEITSLAAELRSMSHGVSSLHRTYLRYQPLPPKLAEEVSSQSPSG